MECLWDIFKRKPKSSDSCIIVSIVLFIWTCESLKVTIPIFIYGSWESGMFFTIVQYLFQCIPLFVINYLSIFATHMDMVSSIVRNVQRIEGKSGGWRWIECEIRTNRISGIIGCKWIGCWMFVIIWFTYGLFWCCMRVSFNMRLWYYWYLSTSWCWCLFRSQSVWLVKYTWNRSNGSFYVSGFNRIFFISFLLLFPLCCVFILSVRPKCFDYFGSDRGVSLNVFEWTIGMTYYKSFDYRDICFHKS